jgi:hypothetical protein
MHPSIARTASFALAAALLSPNATRSIAAQAMPPAPAAQAPAWPADAAGLTALGSKLTESFLKAVASNDAAALDAMLLPCFQRVGFDGARDRAGELAAVPGMNVKDPRVSDVVATRCGDALVVTCQVAAAETTTAGTLDAAKSCRLGIWQPSGSGWKLACWATLHMPETRPAPGAPAVAADEALCTEGTAMLTRYLGAQQAKDLKPFDDMMDPGMQVINFRGQKAKEDLVKGASRVKADAPTLKDLRATRCGELTVVTCSLGMGQRMGFTTLPADPAPFLVVFRGTGDAAKVIATANTNKPK